MSLILFQPISSFSAQFIFFHPKPIPLLLPLPIIPRLPSSMLIPLSSPLHLAPPPPPSLHQLRLPPTSSASSSCSPSLLLIFLGVLFMLVLLLFILSCWSFCSLFYSSYSLFSSCSSSYISPLFYIFPPRPPLSLLATLPPSSYYPSSSFSGAFSTCKA